VGSRGSEITGNDVYVWLTFATERGRVSTWTSAPSSLAAPRCPFTVPCVLPVTETTPVAFNGMVTRGCLSCADMPGFVKSI
jgi:hypothetical protein